MAAFGTAAGREWTILLGARWAKHLEGSVGTGCGAYQQREYCCGANMSMVCVCEREITSALDSLFWPDGRGRSA